MQGTIKYLNPVIEVQVRCFCCNFRKDLYKKDLSMHRHKDFIDRAVIDLINLVHLQERPDPFSPGEPLFWDDDHISKSLLEAHLNPNMDLASRIKGRPGLFHQGQHGLASGFQKFQDAIGDLGSCGTHAACGGEQAGLGPPVERNVNTLRFGSAGNKLQAIQETACNGCGLCV